MQNLASGSWVVLRGYGVARVDGRAVRGPTGEPPEAATGPLCDAYHLRLELGQRSAYVPVASANDRLRPLVTAAVAEQVLRALRKKASVRPTAAELEPARFFPTLQSGSPVEHAELLRRLYAVPCPVDVHAHRCVRLLESRLLGEAALVLGLAFDDLVAEMRHTHPGLSETLAANAAGAARV